MCEENVYEIRVAQLNLGDFLVKLRQVKNNFLFMFTKQQQQKQQQLKKSKITKETRMHSSRMRVARSSSRLLGGVCLSACWDTPPSGPGPGHPLGVGLDTPPPGLGLDTPMPLARPPNLAAGSGPGHPPTSPLGLGLDTPARPPNLPPGPGPRHPFPL